MYDTHSFQSTPLYFYLSWQITHIPSNFFELDSQQVNDKQIRLYVLCCTSTAFGYITIPSFERHA